MKDYSEQPKYHRVEIRLYEQEYQTLLQWKERLHQPTSSDVIRMFICSGVGYYFDFSSMPNPSTELNKIGNNINQIAKIANAVNSVYETDIREIRRELENIENEITKFLRGQMRVKKMISEKFLVKEVEQKGED